MFKNVLLMNVFALLLLSSCKKETADTTGLSSLAIVNASPDLATYNTYLDGTKVIEAALPFGGVISYATLAAGDHTIKLTAETEISALLTKAITLEGSKAYSFFVVDRGADIDGLLISDSPDSYSTEKAFVRFINLSPDAPALDLTLGNDPQNLVGSKSYKEVSGFVEVEPGTFSFNVKNDAQSAVKASLGDAVLAAGYYYTVMAIGLVTPDEMGQSFKLQIYTHR